MHEAQYLTAEIYFDVLRKEAERLLSGQCDSACLKRLREKLDALRTHVRRDLAAFRPYRGTVDALSVVGLSLDERLQKIKEGGFTEESAVGLLRDCAGICALLQSPPPDEDYDFIRVSTVKQTAQRIVDRLCSEQEVDGSFFTYLLFDLKELLCLCKNSPREFLLFANNLQRLEVISKRIPEEILHLHAAKQAGEKSAAYEALVQLCTDLYQTANAL